MSLAVVALAFMSCEKEDNNGSDDGFIAGKVITATVENGTNYNSQIDSVYALAGISRLDEKIIAKAPYENGGFTIILPETISNECLSNFDISNAPKITVSDVTAKFTVVQELIPIKNGNQVGYIKKSNIPNDILISVNDMMLCTYIYVNKPVTISGSNEYNWYSISGKGTMMVIYNLSLLKGWNVYVSKSTQTRDPATLKIIETVHISNSESAELKWYYCPFGPVPLFISKKPTLVNVFRSSLLK